MSSFLQSLGNTLLGHGAFGDTRDVFRSYAPPNLLDVFPEEQQRAYGQQIQQQMRSLTTRPPSWQAIQSSIVEAAKAESDRRKLERGQDYLQELRGVSDPAMTPSSVAFRPEVRAERDAANAAATTGGGNDARSRQAQMYRAKALIAARSGQTEDAKRFNDIAESLDPLEKINPTFQTVVNPATGQRELVRTGDRGSNLPERGYAPAPDFMTINQGGSTRVVDRNTLPLSGASFPNTLAPQVIGSADRGFYQVGGDMPGGAMPGAGTVPGAGAYGTLPGQAGPPSQGAMPPQGAMPQGATPQGAAPGPRLLLAGQPAPDKPDELRREFNTLPQVRNWSLVRPAWESAERAATNNTRAGDLDIIYAVAKTVDPDSVVRESEANMVAAATSPANQFMGLWSMVAGGGRLTPAQRSELMGLVRNRAQSHWDNFENTKKTYAQIASGKGFNPAHVFIDHGDRPTNLGSIGAAAGAVGGPKPGASADLTGQYGLEPRQRSGGRGIRRRD